MRKFFPVILALIFFVLLPIWLVLYNINFNLLETNFYKSVFNKVNIYERSVNLVVDNTVDYLISSTDKIGIDIPDYVAESIESEIRIITHDLITKDFLQENVEMFFDNSSDWIKSDKSVKEVEIKLDIKEIKEAIPKILEDSIVSEINHVVDQFPKCVLEEINITDEENSFCLPAETKVYLDTMFIDLFENKFAGLFDEIFSSIPEEIDIQKIFVSNIVSDEKISEVDKNVEKFRKIYSILVIAFWILTAVLLSLLLYIASLTKKSIRSMIRWLGLTIFIPAIILILPIVFSSTVAPLLLDFYEDSIINTEDLNISSEMVSDLSGLVTDTINAFLHKIIFPIYIIAALGFVLFIIAFFIKQPQIVDKKKDKSEKLPIEKPEVKSAKKI